MVSDVGGSRTIDRGTSVVSHDPPASNVDGSVVSGRCVTRHGNGFKDRQGSGMAPANSSRQQSIRKRKE